MTERDERSARLALSQLKINWGNCRRCRLWKSRSRLVWHRGNLAAPLIIVGEAPGENEDATGIPFVGKAGQLLDRLISGAGLEPNNDTVITNTVLCRPPGNRNPLWDEMSACKPRLDMFVKICEPKAGLLVGGVPAGFLAGVTSITRDAGKVFDIYFSWHSGTRVIPMVATYHTSYIMRQGGKLRETLEKAFINHLLEAWSLANGR